MVNVKTDCEGRIIKTKEIYLAGGMTGLNFEEQTEWRRHISEKIHNSGSYYNCHYKDNVCNPVKYYNFEKPSHITEKEVVRFDLDKVRKSDLLIVNFNLPSSLGAMAEIAIAYEHRIPIIGLNEKDVELHPWQDYMVTRMFTDIDSLIEHVMLFYLT